MGNSGCKREKAEEFRNFIIRLSGRQMKYNKKYTDPALLAGLWAFISMLSVLETYSNQDIAMMKEMFYEFTN